MNGKGCLTFSNTCNLKCVARNFNTCNVSSAILKGSLGKISLGAVRHSYSERNGNVLTCNYLVKTLFRADFNVSCNSAVRRNELKAVNCGNTVNLVCLKLYNVFRVISKSNRSCGKGNVMICCVVVLLVNAASSENVTTGSFKANIHKACICIVAYAMHVNHGDIFAACTNFNLNGRSIHVCTVAGKEPETVVIAVSRPIGCTRCARFITVERKRFGCNTGVHFRCTAGCGHVISNSLHKACITCG